MSRYRPRTFRRESDLKHLVGTRALFEGDCRRCPDPIKWEDRVVRQGDGWIHARCASGGDDE